MMQQASDITQPDDMKYATNVIVKTTQHTCMRLSQTQRT